MEAASPSSSFTSSAVVPPENATWSLSSAVKATALTHCIFSSPTHGIARTRSTAQVTKLPGASLLVGDDAHVALALEDARLRWVDHDGVIVGVHFERAVLPPCEPDFARDRVEGERVVGDAAGLTRLLEVGECGLRPLRPREVRVLGRRPSCKVEHVDAGEEAVGRRCVGRERASHRRPRFVDPARARQVPRVAHTEQPALGRPAHLDEIEVGSALPTHSRARSRDRRPRRSP